MTPVQCEEFISVETHPRESRLARVRLNGVDVTRGAYAALPGAVGWVDRYVRDANGQLALTADRLSIQRERLHGAVVVDFPGGLD